MIHAAENPWGVEESLRFCEDPDSNMTKPGRVLALEVRRLRMEAIEARQKLWDWQRRAGVAEEKLETIEHAPKRPTVHGALGIPQEHAAFARTAYGDGDGDLVMGRPR